VPGSGFDRDVLDDAGISEADALVAVTSGDNTNIVAARIARETYEVPNVVARIYDPRRATLYQRLGIPTVATVSWTTEQVMNKLLPDDAAPDWNDPLGSVKLVQRPVPPALAGRRVSELHDHEGISVVALTRDAETTLISDGLICQEGDVLYLMIQTGYEDTLVELFDVDSGQGGHP
jgi:trk system potassium uptake protein TrkA